MTHIEAGGGGGRYDQRLNIQLDVSSKLKQVYAFGAREKSDREISDSVIVCINEMVYAMNILFFLLTSCKEL